ncbi:G/U mismatch-specific DNA glycosylase [Nonomuraea terrae]|uniref:G/U mismatch-specific DNA glycosylase n=1 Tax=Nonomuraea terrae TaxID=2530383 RepID=A0A4R4XJL1_9ACTN|nr:G/U mismatch-specific DNA glycosylase [Nonomuraea terrae]TDD30899.1 G/U mismatch-specific DNA glycosylase [Nonomuraea terrae]
MLDDVLAPSLDVLFCGINPGLMSEATGHHFARPGNRFWPALHASGFTPRRLAPAEQHLLPSYGLGITNIVPRASAKASELTREELAAGGAALAAKVAGLRPKVLAVLGVSAYRTAFARPKARIGPQDELVGGVRVWVLPNPSGLNAHWTPAALAAEFRRLREALA